MSARYYGHVTCYVADVESGKIRSKLGKNFYATKKSTVRTKPTPDVAVFCFFLTVFFQL